MSSPLLHRHQRFIHNTFHSMNHMSRKRSSRSFRKLFRRAFRNFSQAQIIVSLIIGSILGALLTVLFQYLSYADSWNFWRHSPRQTYLTASSIIPGDQCEKLGFTCFVFVFATGRSGTQHLSRVLKSKSQRLRRTYITHEEEHLSTRTKFIVDRDYRRIAATADERQFNLSAREYIVKTKLPFYNALLMRAGATRLVYTGHVPMAFGMGPALIDALPPKSVRVVRFRRDRITTAVSLMALGPEEEDPWGEPTDNAQGQESRHLHGMTTNKRWFPKPTDAMVRLHVDLSNWTKLNRFQRWLWYVDDIECRWQALRHGYQGRFSYMEEALESLNVMDGGAGWQRVADFIGVNINWSQIGRRDNSIEYKMRAKINISETILRKWDLEYRRAVGPCRLNNKQSYGWQLQSDHPFS